MRAPFQILAIPYKKTQEIRYCVFCRENTHQYQFVAGGGEDNENALDAAIREIEEETGIAVGHLTALRSKAFVPADVISAQERKQWDADTYVIPEYAFGFECTTNIRLSDEHCGFEWLTYEEAMLKLTWDSNKAALYELNCRLLADDKSRLTERSTNLNASSEFEQGAYGARDCWGKGERSFWNLRPSKEEKRKHRNKVLIIIIILVIGVIALRLFGCSYNPPEGWTKKHHTYEEIVGFAKTIDPQATVLGEYTDTEDEYDWKYREWAAVIKGVSCHVASVSDWVWNDGLLAGEFVEVYYRIDTDYDNTIMQTILEKYPEWRCDNDLRSRYHSRYHKYSNIYVELVLPEYRMLDEEELEKVWQSVLLIEEDYKKLAVNRKTIFVVPTPQKYNNGKEDYVSRQARWYIEDVSEEDKTRFLQEYEANWALLESGLPVYD